MISHAARRATVGALALLSVAGNPMPARGQDVVRSVHVGSVSRGDRLGSGLALTGDYRDGTLEIAMGAPGCDWLHVDYGCIYLAGWTTESDEWSFRIVGGLVDPAASRRDGTATAPFLGSFRTGSYLRSVGYVNSDRWLDTFVAADDGHVLRAHVSDLVRPLRPCDGCATHHLNWDATDRGRDGVAGLGDLDGNGAGEYAARDGRNIRVFFHQPTSETRPSEARVVEWDVPAGLGPGSISGIGDVNGDGVFDLVLSGSGRIAVAFMQVDGTVGRWVLRGPDEGGLPGSVTSIPEFGRVMAPAGDVDDDGTPDLWIGLPEANEARGGIVLLLMNPDGSMRSLVQYDGADIERGLHPGDRFGHAIASLRDVYGDGRSEIVVGSPGADVDGVDTGSVHLLSVSSNGAIRPAARIDNRFPAMSNVATRIMATTGIPDFDGDGIDDYLAASDEPQMDRESWEWSGEVAIHLARKDGTVRARIPILFALPGHADDLDRHVLNAGVLPDLDGDGRPEIWVTAKENARQGPFPTAVLYLNADGSVRHHRLLPFEDNQAWCLLPVRDESGDGLPDMIGLDLIRQTAHLVRTDTSGSDALLETRPLYTSGEFSMWSQPFSPGDLDGDGHDDAMSFKHIRPTLVRMVWGRAWEDSTTVRPLVKTQIRVPGLLDPDDIREAYTLGTVRDLDGDGIRELVLDVTHDDESTAGYLYFFNRDATGKRAIRLWGPGGNPVTGDGLATMAWDAGDMTGDGIPEIAVRTRGRIVWISIARLLPSDMEKP